MAGRGRRTGRNTLTHFLSVCDNTVQDVVRLLKSDTTNIDYIDSASSRLHTVARNVDRMLNRYPELEELMALLTQLISDVEKLKCLEKDTSFKIEKVKDGKPGRPVYTITKDQLDFLLDMNFCGVEIAKLLQVSYSTVKRRMRFYDLSSNQRYSLMSDDDLERVVKPITDENHHLGYRSIQSWLRVCGYTVQESRVREALIRLDPSTVALRWCDTVQRRKYSVAGPNSLWHIDGNHKLIRWRFVIHGGIDGFSRLIVFLRVSTDNKAVTVMNAFLNAVHSYGLPSRVRSDHGTENTDVATFMVLQRGPNRGSMLQGKSVHNQRIERLWHDLFSFLEAEGILDIQNEIHMWCLQYVFTPRIQNSLKTFMKMWNDHKLRTERGKTPKQLFLTGAFNMCNGSSVAVSELFAAGSDEGDYDVDFGIDWDGPLPVEETNENDVTVHTTNCPLQPELLAELKHEIDPLLNRGDFGISNFLDILQFVAHRQN